MTTTEDRAAQSRERLAANMARIEELTQRLTAAVSQRKPSDKGLHGPGEDVFVKAAMAWMQDAVQNPAKIMEQQIAFWGRSLTHYVEAQQALARGELRAPADPGPKDKRFANPLWDTHPYFNFIKQQYLMNAEAIRCGVEQLEHLAPADKKRVEYFSKQIVDMMAPTNFFGTNPDALERALATDGESVVKGLENLVRDVEANGGELLVTLADPTAFSVGENIATAKGRVVFRNRMMELIQYAPTTEKVHKLPIVLFPPWINKFYILDLKPQNSLIRWIVDQGYTLFVVSWVNPDASYAETGLDDYIRDGYLAAIDEARRICGTKQVNAIGYCIAGTTLALTLAHLQKQEHNPVRSATFFTTLTDFSDMGEFTVFLNDDFVDGIERQVAQAGYLAKTFMSRTFSFLRSNDLVYAPAIRSYMMGETPPAFDLLYWNGDGTNLPAKMAVEYLRGLCQTDGFVQGAFPVMGEPVSIADVKVPLCAIACEGDHIADWKSSFKGVAQFGSKDKTFILSQSGHIAGIVNPPSKGKYGHYVNDAPMTTPEDFIEGAAFHAGSWWARWEAWLRPQAGATVSARVLDDSAGDPAPGRYVRSVSA
ncbi:class I poly(R)-hydroxyalkanoic acid synthase [Cereibacter sp. SYSU M97828]|nr:class I poly(R)-hydroxyalkanoic acid synthase [Cereibacter flavus]